MERDIARVLIDRDTIADRVAGLANAITQDFTGSGLDEKDGIGEITIVPILTGSFIFVADLIRQLPIMMQINLVSVSSYPGASTVSRGVKWREALSALPGSLAASHVLLIDDILDSGETLRFVTEKLREREPATLRTCVLLRKDRPEARALPVDYVCFDIPDEFVVGYGLDYNGYYRNLPDIGVLTPAAIDRHRGA